MKNKSEPLYEMLEEKLNKGKSKGVEIYEDGEVPKLESDKKLPKLIVFDDLLYDNQSETKQYYIRSRKLGFSCIYLTQSYFKMAKDIRLQCQYIFLGRNLLKRDLRIILDPFRYVVRRITKVLQRSHQGAVECINDRFGTKKIERKYQ